MKWQRSKNSVWLSRYITKRDSVSLLKLNWLPTGWKVGFDVHDVGTANERYGLVFFRPNDTYAVLKITLNAPNGVHLALWDSVTGSDRWSV